MWPPVCVLCGGAGRSPAFDLCVDCETDLPRNDVACRLCAQPLVAAHTTLMVCGACLSRPPPFDAACCPFRYAYPVDRLVQGIKYRGALAQGRVLSELLARGAQQRDEPLPELLIPVPLGQKRFRERGYNQAIELGRYVEKRLGIPMRADLVARVRETREQATLDKRERRKNLHGAFAVVRELPAARIAVIDDVITTGSTVSELARVLKRAGASRVEVWAVARAARDR